MSHACVMITPSQFYIIIIIIIKKNYNIWVKIAVSTSLELRAVPRNGCARLEAVLSVQYILSCAVGVARGIAVELFDLCSVRISSRRLPPYGTTHGRLSQEQLFGFAIFHPSFSASFIVSFCAYIDIKHGAYRAYRYGYYHGYDITVHVYSYRSASFCERFFERMYIKYIRAELYRYANIDFQR